MTETKFGGYYLKNVMKNHINTLNNINGTTTDFNDNFKVDGEAWHKVVEHEKMIDVSSSTPKKKTIDSYNIFVGIRGQIEKKQRFR